jgi:hypothetical protein
LIPPVTGSQADNTGTSVPHPYDQFGLTELDRAIDNIVNNDNVPPYVCRQLIQRFVTSDPSPGYLYRVVQKFKDNGSGVRGDLSAVIKQVLLDGEARSGSVTQSSATFGKQREPVLRLTGPARAFPATSYSGTYTQLTGVNAQKLRIVTSAPNSFNSGFAVSLNFQGNYTTTSPPNPYTNPTSATYSVAATLGIAATASFPGTGIAISNIATGNPCTVNTTAAHGLSTGDAVTITGLANGTFSPAVNNGTFQVTVLGTNSFTVASNCTVAPTGATGIVTPYKTQITTTQAHGLSTGNSVTISGVSGGSFTPSINGTFSANVIDSLNFQVPVKQTTAATSLSSAQIAGANTLDVADPRITNVSYSQPANSNLLTVSTGGPQTNVVVPVTTVNISSIAVGSPCTVTTSVAHKLVSGGLVSIAGVTDGVFGTSMTGTFVPTVIDTTHFTVPVNCTIAASTGNTTKLIRSRVYLMFLTQTTAGGAAQPADGIYDVQTTPTSSSFTVATSDTPTTARGGNVLVPKLGSSYTPISGNTVIQFNNSVNHNMLVGQDVWVDAPVINNQLSDGEYTITQTSDEDHFQTSYLPANLNGGTYPTPSGSTNGVLLYPLVPPALGRSGVVSINQSTFVLGSTEATLTQSPLNSPTVFNFFFPNYKFPGQLANAGLDAPEFQLTTDTNVMNLTNSLTNMVIGTGGGNGNVNGLLSFSNGSGAVVLDIGNLNPALGPVYLTAARTADAGVPSLVDDLATLLIGAPLATTGDPLYPDTRTAIINFVANTTNFPYTLPTPTNQQMRDRVRAIIHLIITSPEYAVQK